MSPSPAPTGSAGAASRASPSASALPTGAAKAAAVRDMFDRIAPRYDLVNRVMTFGLDVGWRRRAVRCLALPRGSVVADVACGTGDLCRELARAGLSPFGVDVSWGMLSHARTRAPLVHGDGLAVPVGDGRLDGLTCGFALRNVADLPRFLAECARVLRPGGRLAFLEVAEPSHPLARFGHRVYFGRVVPWVGARLSDAAAYRYLPRSVAYLPPTGALLADLEGAGFADVRRLPLSLGAAQLITATRSTSASGAPRTDPPAAPLVHAPVTIDADPPPAGER